VHTDPLGTPLAVTNNPPATQTTQTKVVWRARYEPFGLATPDEDPDGDGKLFALDVRFPGQLYDAESVLHDNYFRTYDPEAGRYLEADPIGQFGLIESGARLAASGSDSLHLYVYARSNPINTVDPSGLKTCPCGDPILDKQRFTNCLLTWHGFFPAPAIGCGVTLGYCLRGIPLACALALPTCGTEGLIVWNCYRDALVCPPPSRFRPEGSTECG
jgi:RHS repeat-associated protein